MTRDGIGTVLREWRTLHWFGMAGDCAAIGSLELFVLVSNRIVARAHGFNFGRAKIRVGLIAVAFSAPGPILTESFTLTNRNDRHHPKAHDEASPAAKAPAALTQVASRPRGESPIARPITGPEELQRVLKVVADEAIKLAKSHPEPRSLTLAHIAAVQAKARDRIGANMTFAVAVEQASGGKGGVANARALSYVGRVQAAHGMNEEARSTLRKAAEAIPAARGDFSTDESTVIILIDLIKFQVQAGDREHARESLTHLEQLVGDALKVAKISNADAVMLPRLAGAQAAAGDFDGAFATVERIKTGGPGLGYKLGETLREIVTSASSLKPLEVRRFVRRVAGELGQIKDPAQTDFVLIALAEAQARLGDFPAARKLAIALSEEPDSAVAGGQAYAFLRVAFRQKEAGDLAGARENLRLGYEAVCKHPKMRELSGRLLQIAEGQIMMGDLEGTQMAEAITRGERAEVLARLAVALAVSGQADEARNTMTKALRDAGLDPSDGKLTHPTVTYAQDREIARLHAMAGFVDAALATARSIRDPLYRRMGLADVVQSRAQAGDPLDALRLARGLESPDDRRMALERLAFGLSARLDLESSRDHTGSPQWRH